MLIFHLRCGRITCSRILSFIEFKILSKMLLWSIHYLSNDKYIDCMLIIFRLFILCIYKTHWLILQVVTIVYLIHVFEKPWFSHMVPTHDGKSVMADWITYLVVWYLWLAQIIPFLSNCLWQPHHYSSPTFFIRSLV